MAEIPDSAAVAVIGLAGRFPGAATVEQFWDRLCEGAEMVSRLPEQDDVSQPGFRAAYGILDAADEFDAEFFGYSPAEALIIDPQQRVFLECAHEALDRAGYSESAGRPSVGIFAGGATTGYRARIAGQLHRLPMVDEWQLRLATAPDFLATRAAHKLRLDGPAVAVQTACSTSLVAVHLAIQSLMAGDCEIALAGGATVHVPYPPIRYTEGGIVAPDGHTRAFDKSAQGCVAGSAVALLVLRPLDEALAAGDHVHAVLRGSAINNDAGDKVGFTAPSVAGQARVIRAAHQVAEVEAETITYVEAHGTGTPLGDPIEVAALTRAFRAGTDRRGFCALGSVKTNIGHTDAAAGAAGLIKAVLAAERGLLPPSLNFRTPNPELSLADSPFVIADKLRPWRPSGGLPRRAGVSALGVGGTNAHVVVEEPPRRPALPPPSPQQLLAVSARTPTALEESVARLAAHLREQPGLELADVAWTLRVGRPQYQLRRAFVASDAASAAEKLSAATHGAPIAAASGVVLMFPGQGSQHVGMAAELYAHEPVFRECLDECAAAAAPELGTDLRAVLYPPASDERARSSARDRLATIAVGQPAVFAVECALTALLASWGIRPDAVAGHSLGAYAAACAAGVLPPSQMMRLVVLRGRLLQSLPVGRMLAVRLPPAEVEPLLLAGTSVAAVNGPRQCTVSGPAGQITALAGDLERRGLDVQPLSIATAGHSELVEPIMAEFGARLSRLALRPASIPMMSDSTGEWADPGDLAEPGYWVTHLRAPVQFGKVLATLATGPTRVLVEAGPGRALATLARQHPDARRLPVVQVLPHPLDDSSDLATALSALGRLWVLGASVSWNGLDGQGPRRRVPLPGYPFQRKRFLVPDSAAGQDQRASAGIPTHSSAAGPPGPTARAAGPTPESDHDCPAAELTPAASGNAVEEALREAFAQALGLELLSPADDFFDAGGDSLIATKLAAWSRRRFGVPLTAADVIRSRTVTGCADIVTGRLRADQASHGGRKEDV